jgi:hypothetical protein
MSGYRCEAEAAAGPSREGLLYGAQQLLVRVRLFDGPGAVDDEGRPTGELRGRFIGPGVVSDTG